MSTTPTPEAPESTPESIAHKAFVTIRSYQPKSEWELLMVRKMADEIQAFAESAYYRGAREQREICAKKAKVKTEIIKHTPDPCSYKVHVVDRDSIRNAPVPQFKP